MISSDSQLTGQTIALCALHLSGLNAPRKWSRLIYERPADAVSIARSLLGSETDSLFKKAETVLLDHLKNNFKVIDYLSDHYPALLREISTAPYLLFARGNTSLLERNRISIVGTRKPSPLSSHWAEFVSAWLAERGITVVSGIARGIDTAAHRAALRYEAGSIAVLAHGVDYVYPKSNYDLYRNADTSERLLLLSEYTLQTRPYRHHFIRRNRIITGLSRSLVFVEGGIKSGAMISAGYAAEQSRNLFVFRHRLQKNNAGADRLLNDGAVNLAESFRVDIRSGLPAFSETEGMQSSPFYLGMQQWASISPSSEGLFVS